MLFEIERMREREQEKLLAAFFCLAKCNRRGIDFLSLSHSLFYSIAINSST
jgi:intein/homing endonuclease